MRQAALIGALVFLGTTDAAGQAAGGAPPPSINAPGGVAAGSITGGTFNVPGLSEADRAAADRRHAELLRGQEDLLRSNQQLLTTVARERGIPHATLQAVLARMGEAGVPEEAVEARLRAKADEYISLRAELARRPSDRPDAAVARAKAQALLDRGDLDGARAAFAEGRGHLRARREQTAREEAGLAAEEARVARLSSKYREAAALHEEAAGLLAFDAEAAWARTMDAAGALYAQGDEFGDNAALRDAIATYEKALALTPRGRSTGRGRRTTSAPRSLSSASAKRVRRGYSRRWTPTAPRCRSAPASACRSTGRGRRTTSAPRSKGSASARRARRGWNRPRRPSTRA